MKKVQISILFLAKGELEVFFFLYHYYFKHEEN